MWVTSSLATALKPAAVALGNFDGIHRGHRQVIRPVLNQAIANQSTALTVPTTQTEPLVVGSAVTQSVYATVVTFHPHPQEFFTGQPRTVLTPLDEKVLQLEQMGVEQLVLLPFDRELSALSPEDFVEKILVQHLQVRQISVGQDFCFGKNRSGTAVDLQAIAATYGIHVTIVPLQFCTDERISSSTIRKALQDGNLQQANLLLGRSYSLTGQVVAGAQLGRTLGFPTANLALPIEKLIPRFGVYAVRVTGLNLSPNAIPGVMNIGCRPTVGDRLHPTVEVHLLDWSGDLYGHALTVTLEEFLRPEQQFASLDALKAQIHLDCATAKAKLTAA